VILLVNCLVAKLDSNNKDSSNLILWFKVVFYKFKGININSFKYFNIDSQYNIEINAII